MQPNRMSVLWWGCCLLLAGAEPSDGWAERAGAERPNVVVIMADDLGWRDPGFMGSDYHRTPNLDRLAAEGLVFRQAYANAPVCAPTRAAILTGMSAARTGVYTVGRPADDTGRALETPENQSRLDHNVITLPEAMRAGGYVTGHVGKWHLGRANGRNGPAAHGFDSTVGASRGGGTSSYFAPYGIASLDGNNTPEGEYLTDRLTDEAISFVRDHRDEPFFLWLAHYAVHTPIEADPSVLDRVRGRPQGALHSKPEYAAMIESLDAGVGRLLDELDALGLAENTVVVFVSDNGGGRRVTSMAPLRGFKGALTEGGVRVPCVVRFPGKVAAGGVSETPVMLFDLYPTILELSGLSPADDQPVDGLSWISLLNGTRNTQDFDRRDLVWYTPVYQEDRRGRVRANPTAVLRHGDWKLFYDFETEQSELYDLATDESESCDLAESNPQVVRSLEERLSAWLRATDAEVPRKTRSGS